MEQLNEILEKYDISKNNVYGAGDFNINLANFEFDKIVQQFLDLMGSYSLTPLNNIPTRISKTTASVIDNIFTNANNVLMTKVIVMDISDHYMLYTKITEKTINTAPEEDNLVWNFNRQNIILFQNKIKQTDFSYINSMEQVKLAYSNLSNKIVNTFEETFRKVSLKGKYKNRLPWLTVRLRNMIKIKNKLYYKSIRRPTQINCNNYRNYKRELGRELRTAERDYLHKAIISSASKSKKLWDTINEIINKKRIESYPQEFHHQNTMISNKKEIADGFNDYFVKIPLDLDEEIPIEDPDPLSYIRYNTPTSFFLEPVTKAEVIGIFRTTKTNSAGYDNLSRNIIKDIFSKLAEPITHIINLSFQTGEVPDEIKTSIIKPTYKSGKKNSLKITYQYQYYLFI